MSFVYNYEYKITSASFSQRITALSGSGGTTTGSFTGSFTGSLQGTASYANNALSSSFALSSSYALSASFAPSTPSFPFTGSALITGSLGVTGSVSILGNSNTVGNNFIAQNLTGSEVFRLQNDRDVVIGGGSASTNTQVTINPFRAPATTNYVLQVNAGTDNFMQFLNSPGSTVGGLRISRDVIALGRRALLIGSGTTDAFWITSNGSIAINPNNAAGINTNEISNQGIINSNDVGSNGLYFVTAGTQRGFIFQHLGTGSTNTTQAVFQIRKTFTEAGGTSYTERLLNFNGTYNLTNGVKNLIGIDYDMTITALSGAHYGLLIRPSSTLNGIGHTTNLPTATWHVKGNSDSVGNTFVAENLSNTANVTIGNNGVTTFSFGSGGKVFINAPVGAGDTLLEIRRSTASSGGFIFRSDNGANQALNTTNGAFNIGTVDNSNITLNPGTGAVILNTAVNNYNSLSSTSIQFRVGTLANSSLNRWLNVGYNTNYGMILQAVQNGSTPAIDRLALNPYGGITTLCGELPNSFVDVLVSSGTGLRIYRGGITNGISFKVGNATGFGMLITHEDTTNTSGYANIQIIQGNNAVFSAGRANSATLNNFYGNGYGTIDSYAMMVGVKYDYAANTTRGITFSATNISTNANIIQSVHDGVGKPLSLNPYGGNVSIGNVISPSASLHVRAGSTGSVFLLESNTSASIFTVNNNGSSSFNGSLTVGSTTTSSAAENTLNIYPPPAGGAGEGGQILLAASGGLYTSASMLDTWQDNFRLLRGSNTGGSNAALIVTNLQSGDTNFAGAVTASAYSGLPNDYLYVTRSGSNQTVGSTWANTDIIFNNIGVSKGIAYNVGTGLASLTGGKVYRITARLAWSAAATYNLQYSCYTSADTQIGPTVEIIQSTNGTNNISDGTLEFIYAPGSNTDIKIRCTGANTALAGEQIRADLNTQLIIQQIA